MHEKDVMSQDIAKTIRDSRGAQLRALILSWHLGMTYQHALQTQATELQKEEFEISEDWADIADQIYQSFVATASQVVVAKPSDVPDIPN